MPNLDRRQFMTLAGVAAASAGLAACAATSQGPTFSGDPLLELSVGEAAQKLRAGEFSAEKYAEALIARTNSCQASLNAYISFNADALRASARAADQARAANKMKGPLHGVPLVVKDNIDTMSLPTSGGTKALAQNRPPANAPAWQRLADAGALLAGKANMHELAFGITNNNAAFGPARNPYDPKAIPGGSSGGTAVAIAARMAPGGLGSDTGGSSRIPASLCGLQGFRPTVGRYPQRGVVPISPTRDTVGPMARTVSDLALLDGLLAATPGNYEAANLKGVRLGLPKAYFFDDLDSETATIIAQALERLRRSGVVLVEADIPDLAKLNDAVSFPVALWEVKRALPRYLQTSARRVTFKQLLDGIASPDVKGVLMSQMGKDAVPDAVYKAAVGPNRVKLQAAYRDYFSRNNVEAIIFPTTPLPARPIGQDQTVNLNGKQVPTFPIYIRNTDPSSNAGIPGVSVHAGISGSGYPVGLEFDGPANSDRRLLAIAGGFEKTSAAALPPKACVA